MGIIGKKRGELRKKGRRVWVREAQKFAKPHHDKRTATGKRNAKITGTKQRKRKKGLSSCRLRKKLGNS